MQKRCIFCQPERGFYLAAGDALQHLADVGGLHVMHSAEPPEKCGAHSHLHLPLISTFVISEVCQSSPVNMG